MDSSIDPLKKISNSGYSFPKQNFPNIMWQYYLLRLLPFLVFHVFQESFGLG